MPRYGLVRRIWLTWFSSPAAERPIYRHVLRTAPKRILELGLGTLVRTERLLAVAASLQQAGQLQYVGLDRFEARLPTDPPGVTLKQAHQRLHARAKVQLVPGNIDTSLSRLCNHLGGFDTVIVSAGIDPRHMERCWFFLQRMTGPRTTVFVQAGPEAGGTWTVLGKDRIDELASKTVLRRAG